VFDGPEEVVLDRTPNRHVAFGQGNHTCIGVHLARLQIQVALERILARLIEFEVDIDGPIRYMSGETQGIGSLPLAIHESV
jgi:cytochrome P450